MTEYKGGCLCGQLKWTIEGEPSALAICHCKPCRTLSSCSASNNFIVPRDKFKMDGEIKNWTRKGDSGNEVTYQFCPICPSIFAVDAKAMPDIWIVKPGGCLDEELLRNKEPDMEIYTRNRYPWVKPSGAAEKEAA